MSTCAFSKPIVIGALVAAFALGAMVSHILTVHGIHDGKSCCSSKAPAACECPKKGECKCPEGECKCPK